MKNLSKLIVLLLLTTLTSCVVSGVKGSKNVTTENRIIKSDFDGIKVSMGILVELTQAKEVSVEAEMDDNIHELLITEVKDGILHIYFDEQVGHCKQKTVRLSMPTIAQLKASSGARIKGQDKIKTTELELNTSSGGGIKLDIETTRIDCNASSGASMTLEGICKNSYTNASSGSNIDASKLESVTAKATVSSGANIKVYASNSIDANASSGGSVYCEGSPEQKSINKSSGGSVHVE